MEFLLNIKQEDYAFGSTVDCFMMKKVPPLEEVVSYRYNQLDEFFDKCLSQYSAEILLLNEHKIDRFGDNDSMRYSADVKGKEIHLLDISFNSVNRVPKMDISGNVELAIINVDDNVMCFNVEEDGKLIMEISCKKNTVGYIPSFIINFREKKVFLPDKVGLEVKLHRGYKLFK